MIPATAGSATSGTPMTISSGSPARKPKPSRSGTSWQPSCASELRLDLSADKTLITHGRTQKARFLGYDVIVPALAVPAPRQRAHRAAGARRRGHG